MGFSIDEYFHYLPFDANGLTIEEIRSKLDSEISQLQKHLLIFQTIRNSLVPISQIPIEIISKIFTHAADSDDSFEGKEIAVAAPIPISWVCRQWRQIALATPQIWTTIAKPSSASQIHIVRIGTFIQRSGGLPLSIDLCHPSEDALVACLMHLPRIRRLRLKEAPLDPERVFSEVPRQPASLLESLDLERTPPFTTLRLFSEINPNLKVIHISALGIGRDDFRELRRCATAITQLHLTHVDHFRGDALAFIGFLTSIPNLRELQLARSLSGTNLNIILPTRESLPNLQTMTVYDNIIRGFRFFQWFNIPRASIHLVTDIHSANWEQLYLVLNAYQSEMSFNIRHLELRKVSPEEGLLSICSDYSSNHHSFRVPSDLAIESIWETLELPHLTSISLEGIPFAGSPDALLKLNSVEAIKFIGNADDLRNLIDLLSPYGAAGYRDADGKYKLVWLFPRLKELHLSKLRYEEYQMLLDTLASRVDAGLGQVMLSIEGRACGDWVSSYPWEHPKLEPDTQLMDSLTHFTR